MITLSAGAVIALVIGIVSALGAAIMRDRYIFKTITSSSESLNKKIDKNKDMLIEHIDHVKDTTIKKDDFKDITERIDRRFDKMEEQNALNRSETNKILISLLEKLSKI